MNRQEVILTIKRTGGAFVHIMGAMFGEDFSAGYYRAISDMIKLFEKTPLSPTFEAERATTVAHLHAVQARCEALEAQNKALKEEISVLNRKVDRAERRNKRKGQGLFQRGW